MMGKFFDDTIQGLMEAVEIEKGSIPLTGRPEMAAPTFYVPDSDTELIGRLVEIRKNENISQSELAKMIGRLVINYGLYRRQEVLVKTAGRKLFEIFPASAGKYLVSDARM